MTSRTLVRLAVAFVAAIAVAVAGSPPAAAAKKTYEDKKLGFRIKIEDSYTQTPPKLTSDQAFIVGDWYEDAAKFDARGLRPTFQIFWFVEPKAPPAGAVAGPPPKQPGEPRTREEAREAFRDQFAVNDFDEAMDRIFEINVGLFGQFVPTKDRWANAERDKTVGKIPFECFEMNAPLKKKPKDGSEPPHGFCFLARLTLDRPAERIKVGFFGSAGVDYYKRFEKEFPAMVRSFEELKSATDSRNEGASAELSDDPAVMREQIKKTKLIKGWKAVDTAKYVIVHHEEVDQKLARAVGDHIEAIRAQVYEVMFPPDRPIRAVSVVRVCKDPQQYAQYGGPGGSAGYWYAPGKELVFYEDSSEKDALSVLYHEAFHQYIYYSVGDVDPHSWFNEGHGDYFAGHKYQAGKFIRDVFQWRVTLAKEQKRNPRRPRLKEWLRWSQMQYYGNNKAGLDAGANYALGWSFVYFLRTTKKPEYQGILERYFNALKGAVTKDRALDEAFDKEYSEWEKRNDGTPPPTRKTDQYAGDPLSNALTNALAGVDLDALEKDWLAADN